jgi:hypothetical protein
MALTAGMETPGERDLSEALDRIKRLNDDERFREIDDIQKVWDCKQYTGKPSFWDKSVNLRDRAPVIRDPVVRIAGSRLAAMVFGETRMPKVSPISGDTGIGELQISPEDSATLSDFITAVARNVRLPQLMRRACRDGLRSRTAVTVARLRGGNLHVDTLDAKLCKPKFDPHDPTRVVELEYRYRYADPESPTKSSWHRRLITETSDTLWDRVPCDANGREPNWSGFPSVSRPHEFCPVDWHPNLPDTSTSDDFDGVALCEGLAPEVEALDFARSMKHRHALYNGDPQTVVSGAEPGDMVSSSGSAPARGIATGWSNRAKDAAALEKAPDSIWWLTKADARAGLLESEGAGARILGEDVTDLRQMLFDAMNVVLANPEKLGSGDLSSRALTILFQCMLDFGDELRSCWGASMIRVLGTLLRLACSKSARGGAAIRIPGARAVYEILRRFYVTVATPAPTEADPNATEPVDRWFNPPLELTWGPWFTPSPTEIAAAVTATSTAVGGTPILSTRTAIQSLQPFYPITSVDSELAEVDKETQSAAARTQATLGVLGGGDGRNG